MNIGKTILNIRKEEKMTQEEFGNLFHVTRQTVSNWENEKSFPDLQVLVNISDMFEISLDKLMKEDTHMVKTIDKERHYGKIIKITVCIIAFALLMCIGYGVFWKAQKSVFEENFETALQQYSMVQDTFTEESGKVVRFQSYSSNQDRVQYSVFKPDFPNVLAFQFDAADRQKFVTASYSQDDKTVNLRMDHELTTVMIEGKVVEDPKGIFKSNILAEYYLTEKGELKHEIVDAEKKALYESVRSEIPVTVVQMKKMYQDFFQEEQIGQ